MGEIVCGMLVPHTPRALDLHGASEIFQPVQRGLRALAAEVARLRPDAIVIASAHWVTTFHHYVGGPRRLQGVLGAADRSDASPGMVYDFPGDPELARALVAAGEADGVPAVLSEEPVLPLDCGTVIPLRHLTPSADVPIVPISLCQVADLAEVLRWGRAIGSAVRLVPRRVILAVTGVESRPPERPLPRWPESCCRALDTRVTDLVSAGCLVPPETSLGETTREAAVEAAGGHLVLLLGALGSGCGARTRDAGPPPARARGAVSLSPN